MSNINTEEYIKIKQKAYTMATELAYEEIIIHLKNYSFTNPIEKIIYTNTILYPNDMEIMEQYYDNQIKIDKELAKKMNLSLEVAKYKILEYQLYNLKEILNNNVMLRRLAEQVPKSEINIPNEIR